MAEIVLTRVLSNMGQGLKHFLNKKAQFHQRKNNKVYQSANIAINGCKRTTSESKTMSVTTKDMKKTTT